MLHDTCTPDVRAGEAAPRNDRAKRPRTFLSPWSLRVHASGGNPNVPFLLPRTGGACMPRRPHLYGGAGSHMRAAPRREPAPTDRFTHLTASEQLGDTASRTHWSRSPKPRWRFMVSPPRFVVHRLWQRGPSGSTAPAVRLVTIISGRRAGDDKISPSRRIFQVAEARPPAQKAGDWGLAWS
jgi:hypothetical protein